MKINVAYTPLLLFDLLKGRDAPKLGIKTMRISIFSLVLTFVFQLSAQAASGQALTYTFREAGIIQVFSVIKERTGYSFFYKEEDLKLSKPVTLNLRNIPLRQALNQIFEDQPLQYNIQGKTIFVSRKPDWRPVATQEKRPQKEEPPLQDKIVKGIVKDSTGTPLPDATILVKNTAGLTLHSTATDSKGMFSVKADIGNLLVISYVGYQPYTVVISGSTGFVDILLKPHISEIEEVVITALGIKRAERSLTYNVQEIKGDELTRNKDASFVNSLVGKVAGVTINASSSGVGGATRVVMRGAKSINYNNNALYVIDGIPMTNGGGQVEGPFGGTTNSDNISSVNPEDIESISVLTGAAAASLYGSLGQNGVILITTKSGQVGRSSLSLSNSTSFFTPFVMPRFQNTYGQTEEGSFSSWGAKLSTPSTYNPRDFFQTGNNSTSALTFSTGTEKNQTFVSGAILNADGIIPNNKLRRYNFTFRNTAKFLNDKFTLDFNLMYMRQNEQNLFAQGLYHSPIVPVYLFPPGGDIKNIQAFERYNASRNFPTQFWPFADDQFRMQNPYWITNREFFKSEYNRLLVGLNLKYDINDWLNIAGRAKLERNNTSPENLLYASTNKLFAGESGRFYRGQNIGEQYYFDVMANINKPLNTDFTLTGNVGYSRTDNKSQGISVDPWIPLGAVPNLFNTGNASGEAISMPSFRRSSQALFANGELSYKKRIFLNASLRSDWWSQLYGTGKLHIIYPSVGTSVILSDMLNMTSDAVSFIKLRANYTTVGNPPPAYVTGVQTFPVTAGSPDFGNGIKPSLTLQPERTKGVEVGANLKFLRNKINLDITLYNTQTYNQIFNVPISASSFYSSFYINAGQVNNKGIEAALGYNGKIGNVDWESNATFTLNRNEVVKLIKDYYDAESDIYITRDTIEKGGSGSYSMKVIVGGTLGDIYTSTLQFDDQGRYVVVRGGKVSANNRNIIYAGNSAPDYTIGYRNKFSYKNFNVSFVLFGRFGGVGVSATQAMMDAFGVSEESAKAREKGYVMVNGYPLPGVKDYYTVMGNGINGVLSEYVYSATNIRLKEFAIGYTIPGQWLHNYIKGIDLSLTGQNLFMFYNKAPFDPENTASTGTYYQGIDYFMQPSLRSLGFSVKLKF